MKVRPFSSINVMDLSFPLYDSYTKVSLSIFIFNNFHIQLSILKIVPHLLPHVRADKGAIPYVLAGANVMCPGLTSPGGEVPLGLPANSAVGLLAEGKDVFMAVGILTMCSEDM